MTDRNIRINIDPSGARTGAQKVVRSLEDIRASGKKTATATKGIGSAMNDAMRSADGYVGANRRAIGEINRFVRSSNEATRSARGLGNAMGAVRAAAVGLVGGLGIRSIVGYADAWTETESKLRLVTSSSRELDSVQKQLFASAQANRSSFGATADLYAGLARSTKELGVTQGQLMTVTNAVSQAMVISGADAQAAAGAIRQLSQAFASGTLRGDEFNSVNEAAPRIMDAVAKSIGVTRGELRQMAADGQLTSEILLAALTDSAEEIGAEFGSMSITVGQSLTQLDNAFGRFVGNLSGSTGASSGLASVITTLAENMDLLASAAIGVGTAIAVNAFGPVVVGAIGTVTTALRGATGAMAALNVAVRANPLGLLATAVGLAAGGLAWMATATDDSADATKRLNDLQDTSKSVTEQLEAATRNNAAARYEEANATREQIKAEIEQARQRQKSLLEEAGLPAGTSLEEIDNARVNQRARAQIGRIQFNNRELQALKGVVATIRELDEEMTSVDAAMASAEERFGKLGGAASNASGGTKNLTDEQKKLQERIDDTIGGLQSELTQVQALEIAIEQGEEAVEDWTDARDAFNTIQRLGIVTDSEAAKEIIALTVAINEQNRANDDARDAIKKQADAQSELSRLIDDTLTPAEKYRAKLAEIEKLRPFADTPKEIEAIDRALRAVELEEFERRNREAADAVEAAWGNSIDAVPSVPADDDPEGVQVLADAIGDALAAEDRVTVEVNPQRKAA